MHWHSDLYIGNSLSGREEAVKEDFESGRCSGNIRIITLSVNPREQLDIRKVKNAEKRASTGTLPMIVGLAGSKAEAYSLVGKMAEDCIKETGECDIRDYLISKEEGLKG